MTDDAQLQEWLGGHRNEVLSSRAPSASDHPDIDTLARHASGQLSPAKARAVHEHLLACDDGRCGAFVRANAEDVDAAASLLYPQKPNGPGTSSSVEGGPIHSHTFQCREGLWETFVEMARELDVPVDDVLATAMQEYARHRASAPPPRLPPDTGAHDYSMEAESDDLARTAAREESFDEAQTQVPPRPPMDLPTMEGPSVRPAAGMAPAPARYSAPPPPAAPAASLRSATPPPGAIPPIVKQPTMRMSTAPSQPPAAAPTPPPSHAALGLSQSAPGMPLPPPPPPGAARRASGPSMPPAMPSSAPPAQAARPMQRPFTQPFGQNVPPPPPPPMAGRSVPPPPPSSGGMRAGGRSAPPPLPSAPAVIAQAFAVGPSPAGEGLTLTYQGRPLEVTKERVVLGRSKQNADIFLDDANVSRQHAAIERVGHAWYVVDLGSTNGVYVGGVRITRHRLIDGDVIEITTHQVVATLR